MEIAQSGWGCFTLKQFGMQVMLQRKVSLFFNMEHSCCFWILCIVHGSLVRLSTGKMVSCMLAEK